MVKRIFVLGLLVVMLGAAFRARAQEDTPTPVPDTPTPTPTNTYVPAIAPWCSIVHPPSQSITTATQHLTAATNRKFLVSLDAGAAGIALESLEIGSSGANVVTLAAGSWGMTIPFPGALSQSIEVKGLCLPMHESLYVYQSQAVVTDVTLGFWFYT